MNTPPNPRSPNADDAVGQLIDALIDIDGDPDAFQSLLADRPQVLDEAVEHRLRDLGQMPGFEATFEAFAALVREARIDPERAWASFDEKMEQAQRLGKEVELAEDLITAAVDEGRPPDALKLVQESIEKATRAGLGMAVADLHLKAGQILIRGGLADRDQEVETAIAEFCAGLECAASPEQAALLLMHLGTASPERVRGDRRENADQGVEALRAALDALGDHESDDLDACIRTNLASVMLGRETGDRVQNLSEARGFVETALEFRSVDRDATDWAYSQINLGLILDRLAQEGAAEPEEALAAWQAVIDEADRCPSWLVGLAHHGMGQQLASQAQPSSPEFDDEGGEDEALEFSDENFEPDAEVLRRARRHLRQARTLLVDATDQLARGRALNDLAGVLTELEDIDEAIAVGTEALNLLGPTTSPRDCVIIAGRLGGQLADRGQWDKAAEVFRAGVHAADIAIDTRLDAADRRSEAQRVGNIARWASYSLARVGEPVAAALTLENGRTREVRRRLGPAAAGESALNALPEELRQAYESALTGLGSTRLDGSESNASRALQEVLHQIREQPGFESFAAGTDEQGLIDAVEPHWPLLYINPTPWGTGLLLISDTDAGPQITSESLAPTSTEVFLRLMAGDAAETMDVDEDAEARSYLFGISTDEADHNIREDLDEALPWLGEHICWPIAAMLTAMGAEGVTLVISGPLGAAPVHAAPWVSGGQERCLLDEVDVRYAPSAILEAAAIVRADAAEQAEPSLLALADPGRGGHLPAAVPEVREVAEYFSEDRRLLFEGSDATSTALVDHADQATHIHFACHATGGLFRADESAVVLADRNVTALELTSLVGLQTRLVAISACRSAMAAISEMADEVLSFGTAVLAAGSACAIATLWPVDDAAAALLMTKMYEELQQEDTAPPQALRLAQLWLRDLSTTDEDGYLAAHPALEAEFRRRAEAGDPPGRRGSGSPGAGTFSHPDYWAPFVASGA